MLRFSLFFFLCLTLPAFAQGVAGDDPYTVTGIAVDVKGKNGSEARDKAFTDGGRLALAAVAEKLSGTKGPDFKAVDNNTITRLIKSFEVEAERASGTRYIATLTYHFRPERTDAFLNSHNMAVRDPSEITAAQQATAAAGTGRVLVLPIVRTAERSVLFEEKTDWMRAWENYLSDHPNPAVAVPAGEMDDISTISSNEALAGITGPLVKIMQRYEAQSALVAVLSAPSINATTERDVNVQLAIFDRTGMIRNTSSFNLAAAPGQKPMPWLQDGAGTAIGKWQHLSSTLAAPARPAPNHDLAMAPNGMLQLAINVPFASPQQWQGMRDHLQEIGGVTRFDVVSLTHSRATVLLMYQGSRRAFEAALAEKGMRLDQSAANAPPTLVALNALAQPSPTVNMPPASTFQTVYPPPPAPKDEVIYADPDSHDGARNNNNGDNAGDQGDDDATQAPPAAKKSPPARMQEAPLLIP